jgi:hypothetical protein
VRHQVAQAMFEAVPAMKDVRGLEERLLA